MLNKIIRTFTRAFCLAFLLGITHEAKGVDTQYMSYYIKFNEISHQCGVNRDTKTLRIETDETMKYPRVAVCYYYENIIKVNKNVWDRLSVSKREQTLFHEMGHCLLNLKHDDANLNIMNTDGFINEFTYVKNYDYFIRKLFKDCTKPKYEHFVYEEVK